MDIQTLREEKCDGTRTLLTQRLNMDYIILQRLALGEGLLARILL